MNLNTAIFNLIFGVFFASLALLYTDKYALRYSNGSEKSLKRTKIIIRTVGVIILIASFIPLLSIII